MHDKLSISFLNFARIEKLKKNFKKKIIDSRRGFLNSRWIVLVPTKKFLYVCQLIVLATTMFENNSETVVAENTANVASSWANNGWNHQPPACMPWGSLPQSRVTRFSSVFLFIKYIFL